MTELQYIIKSLVNIDSHYYKVMGVTTNKDYQQAAENAFTAELYHHLKINQVNLRLLLAFSAAYLFTLSIIHLLPSAFQLGSTKQIGIFIVFGFGKIDKRSEGRAKYSSKWCI